MRWRLYVLGFFIWFFLVSAGRSKIGGVDTMMAPSRLAEIQPDVLRLWGSARVWLRTSALPDPDSSQKTDQEIEALIKLRRLGIRVLARVRWSSSSWGEVRPGGGKRLPLDLREAYTRAKRYAVVYGSAVDAFEFENEPDIRFVDENPETYAAFLKACYLGVGAADARRSVTVWSEQVGPASVHSAAAQSAPLPLVVMAPLALPPGPYFEALRRNQVFGYTDAFNFHYYGFAEDFTGVYRQFEDALREPLAHSSRGTDRATRAFIEQRQLPVFLSEYGFGSLGAEAARSVEGRVRQWRWFKAVSEQVSNLKVEAPMAYQLQPDLERGVLEFGLTITPSSESTTNSDMVVGGSQEEGAAVVNRSAGGLVFRGSDFGLNREEPWMARIGTKVGDNEASPALAWLLEAGAKQRYRSQSWHIRAHRRSRVVVDFIAGPELQQLKRYGGYLANNTPKLDRCSAEAQVVLYNFSASAISGVLQIKSSGVETKYGTESRIELKPFERRIVPITLGIDASEFAKREVTIEFLESKKLGSRARFATALLPNTARMSESVLWDFKHVGDVGPAVQVLANRSLATDEPALAPKGRWMLTPNVQVEETSAGTWRFTVEPSEDGTLGRESAELPLPANFEFPEHAVLALRYRLAEPSGTNIQNGRNLQIYFRTQNGNLYVVWPWCRAIDRWSDYVELKSNFTMMFYGRAELPWRFTDNKPVALVFAFGAEKTPLVFEVERPRISRLRAIGD